MDDEDSPRPTEALMHVADDWVKCALNEKPDIVNLLKAMNLYNMVEYYMVRAWIAGRESK